jgi:sterol desaturase/sphingolipid hydroxylase (fatty acid hydroxylase superfamily)
MFETLLQPLITTFAQAHAWLFETVVSPALYALGLSIYQERAFDATEYVLLGAIEITFIAIVLQALERWKPVETAQTHPASFSSERRVDMIYTALNRLGAIPLLMFALLALPLDAIDGWLRLQGYVPPKLEDAWPALQSNPVLSFVVYLIILDFVAYWLHRAQHRFEFWWALHSLHHSQRRMTVWSDDRNHLLDDLMIDGTFALVALLIGIAPAQFVFIIMASRLVESLSHANVRWSFGRLGERLLVSPRFHRVHHAIGLGHEGKTQGVNFAVLFPVWDILFRTADFSAQFPPTGIRDQQTGANYGIGFWEQQWLGLARVIKALRFNTKQAKELSGQ